MFLPGGDESEIVADFKLADLEKVEIGYTKSNLKLGQEMHSAYKINDVVEGVAEKEFRGIKGIRPDFVDFRTQTIYELKPNNPRAIKAGYNQLIKYQQKFQETFGGTWNTVLDKY